MSLKSSANSGSSTGRWLLVSDVDDTLTGDADALRKFAETAAATPALLVCLNSSRPLPSVDRTMAAEFPPGWRPDAMIGAMGTQIRLGDRMLEPWTQRFDGWDRSIVDEVMERLGFEAHRAEMQTPYKASFAVPAARWDEAEAALRATGQPMRIVRSGASDFDVLPPGAAKDRATLFLAEHLDVPLSHLIVAGDSANDLAMFQASERGIVVANARDELRRAVDPQRVYFAARPRAAGVLEGLAHYGLPLREATDTETTPIREEPS